MNTTKLPKSTIVGIENKLNILIKKHKINNNKISFKKYIKWTRSSDDKNKLELLINKHMINNYKISLEIIENKIDKIINKYNITDIPDVENKLDDIINKYNL